MKECPHCGGRISKKGICSGCGYKMDKASTAKRLLSKKKKKPGKK